MAHRRFTFKGQEQAGLKRAEGQSRNTHEWKRRHVVRLYGEGKTMGEIHEKLAVAGKR